MNTIATKTQLPVQQIVQWCGVARGKFYDWRKRYGKVNEHNGLVPRDHWVEEWERQSVIDYFDCHPLDGYRRLTFMMLDEDVVAVSPSTTYRVLSKAGRLDRWNPKPSKKGTGFVQPLRAHQHWHTDISYLNLGGTFYYLCSFLDGASRAVVHWEIRESMTEADVECILERAKERYPDALAPILFDDDDTDGAQAKRSSIVSPATSSDSAQAKASTKKSPDGLPVHSFRTLLSDLATVTKNQVENDARGLSFVSITRPTPLQHKAFNLLGINPRTM